MNHISYSWSFGQKNWQKLESCMLEAKRVWVITWRMIVSDKLPSVVNYRMTAYQFFYFAKSGTNLSNSDLWERSNVSRPSRHDKKRAFYASALCPNYGAYSQQPRIAEYPGCRERLSMFKKINRKATMCQSESATKCDLHKIHTWLSSENVRWSFGELNWNITEEIVWPPLVPRAKSSFSVLSPYQ